MSSTNRRSTRQLILDVTAELLERLGAEVVSIRDVCQAAEVTAPTVYHHFGDKKGLFEAVATEGFDRYLANKRSHGPSEDPMEDLRRGWQNHVEFGLAHPAFYGLMFGAGRTTRHPAAKEGDEILQAILARLAEQGRLRVLPEQAARTIHAAAVGTTSLLISDPGAPGNEGLSDRTRDAVFAAVTTQEPAAGDPLGEQARTLLATLAARHGEVPLTPGELGIFLELLRKLG
ncbi:AcrR family transcriptional regulator [Saccharothrix coeruleofusca]|uniref:TetR/AcrR family transcriptional regulator n=1 Tax=Saccharothrix coeruleofusca TaxID=33919 RepID=UPI001AE53AF4|nr:TetR/AcrR family transcriptional regulator [Saccharothrix coeruleofusca]MBP2336108.1 AcrR family transcriptional regulator [Saccharothrix coeruleofusca]